MKQSGLMGMEFNYGIYFAMLCGDQVQAWKNDDEMAFYVGSIEGLQEACPELFQAMLEQKAIKPA